MPFDHLSRQARDKHWECTQKETRFLIGTVSSCRSSTARAARSPAAATLAPSAPSARSRRGPSTDASASRSRFDNSLFCAILCYSFKSEPFCQDRLGTNIGKALTKEHRRPFCSRSGRDHHSELRAPSRGDPSLEHLHRGAALRAVHPNQIARAHGRAPRAPR